MSEQKQTVKVMTVEEWIAQDPSTREWDAVSRPFYSMQQFAEYYHAEKMKQVGNDAKQAAEEYALKEFNVNAIEDLNSYGQSIYRDMVEIYKAGWQAKPSDAVFTSIDESTPVDVDILLLCTGRQKNIVIGRKNTDKHYPYSSWDFNEDEDVNVIGWMPLPNEQLYSQFQNEKDK